MLGWGPLVLSWFGRSAIPSDSYPTSYGKRAVTHAREHGHAHVLYWILWMFSDQQAESQ